MKGYFRVRYVLMLVCLMGLTHIVHAQSTYKIKDSKETGMKLSGTSTLHKWVMNASTFAGEAQFGFSKGKEGQLVSLTGLTFSLAVSNLKSDKKALDQNAYKALKTDRYKDISYKLTSATVSSEKERQYVIKTKGNLSIAGVTKEVAMDVNCVVNEDATIRCSGSDKLKMTDYQIKPPSFMLGAMKTGDAITLDFIMVYKKI